MVHKGRKAYLINLNKQGASDNVKQSNVSKKAKIIVRNLPFKNLCEESVEDFFQEYGDIEEVKLLRKDDGKFVGCGFVQFKKVTSAAKAIRHANQKEMNGRKIIVDWALPKKIFLEKVQELDESFHKVDTKEEVLSDDEKIEFVIDKTPDAWNSEEESDLDESKVKDEKGSDTYGSEDEIGRVEENSKVNSEDNDFEEDNNKTSENSHEKCKISNNLQKSKCLNNNSNDVEDGKTVFVRNIPFSATNEDLKSCLESYGPVEYALICIDKLTEHSKGTGFVKFKDKESASQCLKDSTKIYLQDNPLNISIALSKTNLENKKNSKKTAKDSRNLYLIREGVVIAGSKAAAGVSAGDMAKRLQLEQWKNQILKNLNMFVSKTRLVIHNLPSSYDDFKLRNLFMKYTNPQAVIKEAKVMYDKKKLDATGRGVSKEVGFVSFINHEDALQALRNINNNPEIFGLKKRPIVAFSIENKAVINAKLKRIEKSRVKLGINETDHNKSSKLNRKQRRFLKRREKFIERRREAKRLKQKQESENIVEEKNSNNNNNSNSNSDKKNSNSNSDSDSDSNKMKRKNLENIKSIKRRRLSNSIQNNENDVRNTFTGVISESGKKIKLRSKFRLKNQANIHSQTLKKERRKRRERERKKIAFQKPQKGKKQKMKLLDDPDLSKLLKKHRESIQQSSIIKKWYDN